MSTSPFDAKLVPYSLAVAVVVAVIGVAIGAACLLSISFGENRPAQPTHQTADPRTGVATP